MKNFPPHYPPPQRSECRSPPAPAAPRARPIHPQPGRAKRPEREHAEPDREWQDLTQCEHAAADRRRPHERRSPCSLKRKRCPRRSSTRRPVNARRPVLPTAPWPTWVLGFTSQALEPFIVTLEPRFAAQRHSHRPHRIRIRLLPGRADLLRGGWTINTPWIPATACCSKRTCPIAGATAGRLPPVHCCCSPRRICVTIRTKDTSSNET